MSVQNVTASCGNVKDLHNLSVKHFIEIQQYFTPLEEINESEATIGKTHFGVDEVYK